MAFLCGSPGAACLSRPVATVKTARAASIVPAAGQQPPDGYLNSSLWPVVGA